MHFGIVVFPGTWSDGDCYNALHDQLGQRSTMLWHKDTDLQGVDCVVLPGGFSYGDYLRCGAIARFSPVMQAVAEHAARGGLVIGICNGFQILCEAGLVPGILLPNRDLQFHCESVHLVAANRESPFTRHADGVLVVPISHGEGNYFAEPELLERLEANGQVAFRYCDATGAVTDAANPNGSLHNIAGVLNERGNVLGMMPHPERACEDLLGSEDGSAIFRSLIQAGAAAVSR